MRPAFVLLWGVTLATTVLASAQDSPFTIESRDLHRMPLHLGTSDATRRAGYLAPNRPTNLVRATLLAQAYFDRHLGGCGGIGATQDETDRWVFPTRVGDAGSKGPDIRVGKRTGTTSAEGLPTVTDPSAVYGPPKVDRPAEARRYEAYERRTKGPNAILCAAARIGPRQEIGEYEAWLMSKAYFIANFGACGGVAMPRSDSRLWTTHTKQGAAGRPGPDIVIDRLTGDTWAKGHPRVSDPRIYAKLARGRALP